MRALPILIVLTAGFGLACPEREAASPKPVESDRTGSAQSTGAAGSSTPAGKSAPAAGTGERPAGTRASSAAADRAPTDDRAVACALLDREAAAELLADAVGPADTQRDPRSAKCFYGGKSAPEVRLMVELRDEDGLYERRRAAAGPAGEDLDGVGERAFYRAGAEHEVVLVQGGRMVRLAAIPSERGREGVRDRMVTAARRIAGRL